MRLRDFVFAYAKNRFSHDAAHIVETQNYHYASMLMHYAEILKAIKMNGERGGLVVNASDSGSRGQGFEPHSGQTVLCP